MTEAERLAKTLTESWGVREEGRRQWRLVPCDDADAAAAELLRLQAESESRLADAERYQWFQGIWCTGGDQGPGPGLLEPLLNVYTTDELNAAIDEARKA